MLVKSEADSEAKPKGAALLDAVVPLTDEVLEALENPNSRVELKVTSLSTGVIAIWRLVVEVNETIRVREVR